MTNLVTIKTDLASNAIDFVTNMTGLALISEAHFDLAHLMLV